MADSILSDFFEVDDAAIDTFQSELIVDDALINLGVTLNNSHQPFQFPGIDSEFTYLLGWAILDNPTGLSRAAFAAANLNPKFWDTHELLASIARSWSTPPVASTGDDRQAPRIALIKQLVGWEGRHDLATSPLVSQVTEMLLDNEDAIQFANELFRLSNVPALTSIGRTSANVDELQRARVNVLATTSAALAVYVRAVALPALMEMQALLDDESTAVGAIGIVPPTQALGLLADVLHTLGTQPHDSTRNQEAIRVAIEELAPLSTDHNRVMALVADLGHPDPSVSDDINQQRVRDLSRQVRTDLARRKGANPALYAAVSNKFTRLHEQLRVESDRHLAETAIRRAEDIAEVAGADSDLVASTGVIGLFFLYRQLLSNHQRSSTPGHDVPQPLDVLDAEDVVGHLLQQFLDDGAGSHVNYAALSDSEVPRLASLVNDIERLRELTGWSAPMFRQLLRFQSSAAELLADMALVDRLGDLVDLLLYAIAASDDTSVTREIAISVAMRSHLDAKGDAGVARTILDQWLASNTSEPTLDQDFIQRARTTEVVFLQGITDEPHYAVIAPSVPEGAPVDVDRRAAQIAEALVRLTPAGFDPTTTYELIADGLHYPVRIELGRFTGEVLVHFADGSTASLSYPIGRGDDDLQVDTTAGLERETFSDEISIELSERLDEDDAAALWRELEPLRTEITKLLHSDSLSDDVALRTTNHLDRLEAELGETGGALGGAVRSYYFELVGVLVDAYEAREVASEIADGPAASTYFQDLLAGIDTMAADTQRPEPLGPVLDVVEGAAIEAHPDLDPAEARAALGKKVGLGERFSDWVADTGEGLREVRGWSGFGSMVGAATGAALTASGVSVEASAAVGLMIPIEVTLLAMANRAYRISKRK